MGPGADDVADAMRAADHEGHILCPFALLLQQRGERTGVQRLAARVAEDEARGGGQALEQPLPSFRITTAPDADRADSSFTSTGSSGQYRAARPSYSRMAAASAASRGFPTAATQTFIAAPRSAGRRPAHA